MKKRQLSLKTELLILPDGRILVQNLTQPMAELLRELNPGDRQIAPRAREKYAAHDRDVAQLPAGGFPPRPDPLPRGEGTAIGCNGFTEPSIAIPTAGLVEGAANVSPSPRGEGRGEGKRDSQPISAIASA
jgi:hypothetical protein